MQERAGYLLCVRIDGEDLPGLPGVIGYVDLQGRDEENIYRLLLQRIGNPCHDDSISGIAESDRSLAADIIHACYRRAIFTRMDSEINLQAMYDSIGQALGRVQYLQPRIRDQRLQFVGTKILEALDNIERVRTRSDVGVSIHLDTPSENRSTTKSGV
jgi:hypothetical protein